jgi:hypothetical protein
MFKKEDIKVDYLLEIRRGIDKFLVRVCYDIYDDLGVENHHFGFDISSLDDVLTYGACVVTKIYGRAVRIHSHKLSTIGRELLWERQEPKKMVAGEILEKLGFTPENFKTKAMTVEEICQELGCEVVIVDE